MKNKGKTLVFILHHRGIFWKKCYAVRKTILVPSTMFFKGVSTVFIEGLPYINVLQWNLFMTHHKAWNSHLSESLQFYLKKNQVRLMKYTEADLRSRFLTSGEEIAKTRQLWWEWSWCPQWNRKQVKCPALCDLSMENLRSPTSVADSGDHTTAVSGGFRQANTILAQNTFGVSMDTVKGLLLSLECL